MWRCLPTWVYKWGGTDSDVKTRISKARVVFFQLKRIWSNTISRHTMICLFNSNIKSVLLYRGESWRTIKATMKEIQMWSRSRINACSASSKSTGAEPSSIMTSGSRTTNSAPWRRRFWGGDGGFLNADWDRMLPVSSPTRRSYVTPKGK